MLLVIAGRGIYQTTPGQWDLTDDLEVVANDRGAHLPFRVPADDENGLCVVGGGKMNLTAGIQYFLEHRPELVTLAFGDRHLYLRQVNAPSENEVMTKQFVAELGKFDIDPPVEYWKLTPDETRPNSKREIQNSLELAVRRRIKDVTVITLLAHAWRLSLFLQELKYEHPEFRELRITLFTSEEILLAANPIMFGEEIRRMHSSRAFMRTIRMEGFGINRILNGTYQ
jgi:hypothetical protein